MSGTRMLMRVAGACVALIGLAMLTGGTWLVLLGGSGFYLVAGLACGGNAATRSASPWRCWS